MKKIYIGVLVCVCAALCSGFTKGPSATVESFAKAIEEKDYKKAYSYLSKSDIDKSQARLKAEFSQVKAMISMMPAEAAEELLQMDKLLNSSSEVFFVGMMEMSDEEDEESFGSLDVLRESIDGDKATVWCRDEEGEEEEMDLIKENGKWLLLLDMGGE